MLENQNICVVCQKLCQVTVQNADLPLCRECLNNQAASLKEFHVKLKEDYIKNPHKVLYSAEIDEILPNKLFLGNVEAAESMDLLRSKNITHILVCGEFLDVNFPDTFQYLQIPIQDSLTQTILEYLDQTNNFIEEGDCVFVHCAAGINRSPAIVCAFLMKKHNWQYDQAFQFTKERRQKANKQSNFHKQLLQYEKSLGL